MFRRIVVRILLSPFSLLYGIVISMINFAYDLGLMKASKFSIPIIGVGNLSIGGAGKTPHVEYLIEMTKDFINVSTLSRGYKRQSKGFRFVNQGDTALTVGDEPLQYKLKYPDIVVAVAESRAYAIPEIIKQYNDIQLILLDDSFQHRSVKPGLSILLTAYNLPFSRDYLIPSGRLREWRSGYIRADIIIVTKCSPALTKEESLSLIEELEPQKYQSVFFTFYEYSYPYSFFDTSQKISLDEDLEVILLSAIANTEYLVDYLETQVNTITEIEFEDHHLFDHHDIERISRVYKNISNPRKIILTTEKDAMRLHLHIETLKELQIPIFVLPLKVKFLFDEAPIFEEKIKNFLLNFEV